jgi:hypothetical protein
MVGWAHAFPPDPLKDGIARIFRETM